jgi:hypothetical protein
LRIADGHGVVNRSRKEYINGDNGTNTVEGFFALLKRGVYGTFHAVSKKHLHRYCAEFEFRWNTWKVDDGERLAAAIRGADGKRLMYCEPVDKSALVQVKIEQNKGTGLVPNYPHFLWIGFGLDRLCDFTPTVLGPGLPTRSGLHLVFMGNRPLSKAMPW